VENKNTKNDILDNIIAASSTVDLQLAEDIYDVSGQKLLAKGYKITPDTREKILNKALKKPLETSINSENPISHETIIAEAKLLLENCSLLKAHFIKC